MPRPAPQASESEVLAELPNLVQREHLGGSRCTKSFLCMREGAPVVAKVFLRFPASKEEDLEVKHAISALNAVNRALAAPSPQCRPGLMPAGDVVVTDNALVVVRDYAYSTVLDRLGTRPFLSPVEVKWLGFQMIAAVADAHSLGLTHGDVKLENFLVTSWGAVALSDFAPYKPGRLPSDSPALYSLFYDTGGKAGGRRRGYLAPERFYDPTNDDPVRGDEVLPAMDVFSLGCALVELFLEGQPWMDLGKLLTFARGDISVEGMVPVDRLPPGPLRQMLCGMLSRDPVERPSAAECLSRWQGSVFPPAFQRTLRPVMQLAETHSGAARVEALRVHFAGIVADLTSSPPGSQQAQLRLSPAQSALLDDARRLSAVGRKRLDKGRQGSAGPAESSPAHPSEGHLARDLGQIMARMSACGLAARAVAAAHVQRAPSRRKQGGTPDSPGALSGEGDEEMGSAGPTTQQSDWDTDLLALVIPVVCVAMVSADSADAVCDAILMIRALSRAILAGSDAGSSLRQRATFSGEGPPSPVVAGVLGDVVVPFLLLALRDSSPWARTLAVRGIAEVVLSSRGTISDMEARVLSAYVLPSMTSLEEETSPSVMAEYAVFLCGLAARVATSDGEDGAEARRGALAEGADSGADQDGIGGVNTSREHQDAISELETAVMAEIGWIISSKRPEVSMARAAVAPVVLWITDWGEEEHSALRDILARDGKAALFSVFAEGDPSNLCHMLTSLSTALMSDGRCRAIGSKVHFLVLDCLRKATAKVCLDALIDESEVVDEADVTSSAESAEWAAVACAALGVLEVACASGTVAESVRADACRQAIRLLESHHTAVRSGACSVIAAAATCMDDATAYALLLPAVEEALPSFDKALGLAGLRSRVALFMGSRGAGINGDDYQRDISGLSASKWPAPCGAPIMKVATGRGHLKQTSGWMPPRLVSNNRTASELVKGIASGLGPEQASAGAEVLVGALLEKAELDSSPGTNGEEHTRVRDRLQTGATADRQPAAVKRAVADAIMTQLSPPDITSTTPHGLSASHAIPSIGVAQSHRAWRPQGVLVAHLVEHSASVTAISVSPSRCLLASASLDGTAKVWHCPRLEAEIAASSSATYYHTSPSDMRRSTTSGRDAGPSVSLTRHTAPSKAGRDPRGGLSAVAFVGESAMAVGGRDGSITLCDLEREGRPEEGAGAMNVQTRWVSGAENGVTGGEWATKLLSMGPHTFMYVTTGNIMCGVDTRVSGGGLIWSLRMPPVSGRVTDAVLEGSSDPSWVVVGTSTGVVSSWDLRFGQMATSWRHPGGLGVAGLAVDQAWSPSRPSKHAPRVWVSTLGNEVALWDVEAGAPQSVLKGSDWRNPCPSTQSTPLALMSASRDAPRPSTFRPDDPRTAVRRLENAFTVPGEANIHDATPGVTGPVLSAVLPCSGGEVITGGSDAAVRIFVPGEPSSSYLMCAPFHDMVFPLSGETAEDTGSAVQAGGCVSKARVGEVAALAERDPGEALQQIVNVHYRPSVQDGVRVLEEVVSVDRPLARAVQEAQTTSKLPPLQRWEALLRQTDHQCHRDAILGLDWALGSSDMLLVSHGRDGAVKLWR